jgi:hypothetical protein
MFLLPRPPMNRRAQTDRDRDTTRYGRCGPSSLELASLSQGRWHNFDDSRRICTQHESLCTAFNLGSIDFDLSYN